MKWDNKKIDEEQAWKRFLRDVKRKGSSLEMMEKRMRKEGFETYIRDIFELAYNRCAVDIVEVNKNGESKDIGGVKNGFISESRK